MVPLLIFLFGNTGLAGDWPERRVAGRFILHADFSLDDYQPLIAELESLQRDVSRQLQMPPVKEPILLFLFKDRDSYRVYLQTYFPGVPNRRALFIKGRAQGMVFAYRNPEFEVDLRHEATHAMLHTLLPMVPLWLDEGLAEYFEVPSKDRAHGNPHLSPTRWAARFYRMSRLGELEELDQMSQMGRAEYRAAWAWIHFMLHGPPEAHEQLLIFLHNIRRREPPEPLSGRLEQAMPDLNKQYLHHFRNW